MDEFKQGESIQLPGVLAQEFAMDNLALVAGDANGPSPIVFTARLLQ